MSSVPPPPPPPGMPPPPPPLGSVPFGVGGASLAGTPAAWWKRALATIIDLIITGLVSGLVAGRNIEKVTTVTGGTTYRINGAGTLVFLVLWVLYSGILNAVRGQTVGKMALGIHVARVDGGGKIAMGPSLLRSFIQWLLWQVCLVPGIVDSLSPLWDKQKQTWHDKAASAIVLEGKPST